MFDRNPRFGQNTGRADPGRVPDRNNLWDEEVSHRVDVVAAFSSERVRRHRQDGVCDAEVQSGKDAHAAPTRDRSNVLMTVQPPVPLSSGDALGLLLSAEGLLLAAVALAVTLAAPNQPRQRKYMAFDADTIMNVAVGIIVLVAAGSIAAWFGLCHDGSFSGCEGKCIAASLMSAIIGMPAVAWALVMGSKRA